jgi:hypothetical protein
MTRQIFRKEALERLSSPEQLDQLMQVTGRRGWAALAAVGLIFLAALLWGLFGSIPTTVGGQGFLLRAGGIRTLTSPRRAVVERVLVQAGEDVEPGQELVRLAPTSRDGKDGLSLTSPYAARVLAVAAAEGDHVEAGAALATLEPRDGELEAVLYIPADEGYQVQPGMPAEVWPAAGTRGQYGGLLGKVRRAAKFPAGRADLLRQLPNEDMVRTLAEAGPSLEVVVELRRDLGTASGYKWSSSRGPNAPLYGGTPCQGRITVSRQPPIRLLLPVAVRRPEPEAPAREHGDKPEALAREYLFVVPPLGGSFYGCRLKAELRTPCPLAGAWGLCPLAGASGLCPASGLDPAQCEPWARALVLDPRGR